MNRQLRRAKESLFKKQVSKALIGGDWGDWEDKTIELQVKAPKAIFFMSNNIYSVQCYPTQDYGRVIGIRRHDQAAIPWLHKQRIKKELIGDVEAFEKFPKEESLIDQANMYWLWIPATQINSFDLRTLSLR